MPSDCRGLAVTCASEAAAAAFDHAVAGYLGYRLDTAARVKACLDLDPDFCLGQVLRGYLTLAAFNQATVPAAREALAAAEAASAAATISLRSASEMRLATLLSLATGSRMTTGSSKSGMGPTFSGKEMTSFSSDCAM